MELDITEQGFVMDVTEAGEGGETLEQAHNYRSRISHRFCQAVQPFTYLVDGSWVMDRQGANFRFRLNSGGIRLIWYKTRSGIRE